MNAKKRIRLLRLNTLLCRFRCLYKSKTMAGGNGRQSEVTVGMCSRSIKGRHPAADSILQEDLVMGESFLRSHLLETLLI
jgi:hypothetical protein